MQTAINFVTENLDSIFIPLCALFVVRILMCRLELWRSERLRQTRQVYHARCSQYAEIYLCLGALLGGIVTLLLGRLWLIGLPVMLALGYVGWRVGRKKGLAVDEQLRQEARAARAAAEAAEADSPALPEESET